MRIKRAGDPVIFEYWCFGIRVAFRMLLVSLVASIILGPALWLLDLSQDWLHQFMMRDFALTIVLIAGIVFLPFAFVAIAFCTKQFQDSIADVAENLDSGLDQQQPEVKP